MLLDRLLPIGRADRPTPRAEIAPTPGPDDDFWYTPALPPPSSGMTVTADTALTVSAVWDAVWKISKTVAQLPCLMYRRRPDGGREPAPGHPIADLLHYQPNPWQTAFQFWEMAIAHVLLRGNFYARIDQGPRGEVDRLVPLHPGRMEVVDLPDGMAGYLYRDDGGKVTAYAHDDVFHLVGHSVDGRRGLSVVSYARESLGLSLATESYGARFFSQGSKPAGLLKTPNTLTEDQYTRVRQQWEKAQGGLNGAHRTAILEKGLEWQAIALSAEDSQFLQTRQHGVEDVARWFDVPVHMLKRSATPVTYASAFMFNLEFRVFCISPLCKRIEQTIRKDLIVADRTYYAEFDQRALMRGDPAARSAFYHNGILDGWLTRNEARLEENYQPLPGLDAPLEPRNMAPAGSQGGSDETVDRAGAIVTAAATRVVRKELAALRTLAQKHAPDHSPTGWVRAVGDFYAKHAAFVAAVLQLPADVAGRYCEAQRQTIVSGGLAAAASWEQTVPGVLVALALGGDHDDTALDRADATPAAGDAGADPECDLGAVRA